MQRGGGGGAFRSRGGELAHMGGMCAVRAPEPVPGNLGGRGVDGRGLVLSDLGPSAVLSGRRRGVGGGMERERERGGESGEERGGERGREGVMYL